MQEKDDDEEEKQEDLNIDKNEIKEDLIEEPNKISSTINTTSFYILEYKEKLCCIELSNNNRIYLKYELKWTIKDLIKNIVNHPEFKRLYSSRDWIFLSKNHLPLFDVHLAPFRKLKRDNETKLDFNLTFENLHNKGLLKNPKYPFFIFKDNRNNGDMLQFHEDKIEALKKIKDNENEIYLLYENYLPRISPLIILNSNPELENFYQETKPAINQLSEYNINPLIYKRKKKEDKKSKKEKKENIEEEPKNELDWFVYDDESMNFLTTLDKEDFKLSSNIKFLEDENQKSKVLFEDVYENNRLTEEEMKNMFVNVSYLPSNNQKEITKKLKLELTTTGYDLCENMRKKLSQLNESLSFDSSQKILKVKSLNDYILNMKTPLSQYAYINECVMRNRTPEYIILDDPLLKGKGVDDLMNSTQNKNETIKINMKDNSNIQEEIKKFVKISKSKEINENKDDLVLFIDSLEESINKNNIDEIANTQKVIKQKEKEYLGMNQSQSLIEDTFTKQQETIIFDDDDILMQAQNKLNMRASRISNNKSIFSTNLSGIQNVRTSGFINPNFIGQNQIRDGKEGVVHSIYGEDILFNILNESFNDQKTASIGKQPRKGGPVSMMTKSRSKKELEPNVFETSIKEDIKIFPLLVECSLPLNIRQIKMPFSILFNYIELNQIFNSFPKSDKLIEVLVFKFQINIGDEQFCPPVSIKWVNKRNKKNKVPSNPLFNKRIYFETEYSTLPTFSTLIIKVKHLIYGDSNKLLTTNTVQWVNFKLFDHNRNLMTGKHKLNLHSKEFTDFSYFVFVDNITDENPSKVYFEIESFVSQVHNSPFKDDNVDINAENVMITKKDEEELEKIKRKTPFDSLNNYDKKILWTNRYKLSKIPELLPKLLLCVDYKNPQHVMELKKVLRIAVILSPVQSMELLTGKYLHEYIRSFAVNCLRNSSMNEIETYLIQLVQCLKYEMYHDNKLAIFLLKLSVAYPLTVGHIFFWSLRSEMHNANVQQRFGLYLQVFLSKIGPKLLKIYEQEIEFIDRMNIIAQIPKDKKITNKNQMKAKFIDALTEYNNEITSKNLEISMPLNFKLRIKGIIVNHCRYMKSKKKPLWLTLRNAEEGGENIVVMFKSGDDLRMDIVTLQLFKIMQTLWYKNHLYLKMSIYNVISTGDQEGMLEMVTNSATVAQIHKEQGGALQSFKKDSIKNWINNNKITSIEECYQNFLLSNVAYCCATFVLGIGDRHSDNIMLKKNGELFHIDFGHFLGHFKYKMGIKRERAPFVFTNQFKNVLDSSETSKFEEFKSEFWKAYKVLREHSDVLVTLLRILICTDIPELKEKDIEYLNQSLVLNYNTKEAETFLENKLKESIDSWSVPINFWIHYIANK